MSGRVQQGIRRKREKKAFYGLPNQSGRDWREAEFCREGGHFGVVLVVS